ncbi:hypothetical protein B0O99DRAFT_611974 [Bisporella sp. PMI_857]|nr:hypothetical protein B0O99DRAFT_611974 [Bisporella sp. PMI_857]
MTNHVSKYDWIDKHQNDETPPSYLDNMRTPSKTQYIAQEKLWEEFLIDVKNSSQLPDIDGLKKFAFFSAARSRGRLAEHADVKTLSKNMERFFYQWNRSNNYQIPKQDLADCQKFITTTLSKHEGLRLQDLEFDKEYCDWEDVQNIIYYMIAKDTHKYRNPRFLAQAMVTLLIISDDGERIGAVARSDCYRNEEIALLYEDVDLVMKPTTSPGQLARFEMTIRFHNRKNERDTKRRLDIRFLQRPGYAHCIILWFLALALQDNVFYDKSIKSPADLFHKQNPDPIDRRIRFKPEMLQIPICRRMGGAGKRKLSPILPWNTGPIITEFKRIVEAAGYPQRWTFYTIRRTLANAMNDSRDVSDAWRKTIMGHTGEKDRVFRENYQSTLLTVDTGNLFRKEAPRAERKEVLNMRAHYNPNLPRLPKEEKEEHVNKDADVQYLLESKKQLQLQLLMLEASEPRSAASEINITTIRAAIRGRTVCLRRRRDLIRGRLGRKFMKDIMLDPDTMYKKYPPVANNNIVREGLTRALYPNQGHRSSPLFALEMILDHINSENSVSAAKKNEEPQHLHLQNEEVDDLERDLEGRGREQRAQDKEKIERAQKKLEKQARRHAKALKKLEKAQKKAEKTTLNELRVGEGSKKKAKRHPKKPAKDHLTRNEIHYIPQNIKKRSIPNGETQLGSDRRKRSKVCA